MNNNLELEIKFLLNKEEISEIKEKIENIPKMSYKGRAYEKTTMLDNKEEHCMYKWATLNEIESFDGTKGLLQEFDAYRNFFELILIFILKTI